ncbi:MAG TPA: BatD family protein [Dokdonella sp.]|uniref:BatD family protein n=1 Tax=Dokdonella sp. TaxID=2291710 RepID=UPI0025BF2CFA|nr:BatD family protein [Dokdonella sp.]MBX3690722.1 protein BatD [Dokdonella sp.]MCW5566865.1 protein BatD [Dokdonella sp.]HNR91193.1 BatD family protein [Dokdonella sp.]
MLLVIVLASPPVLAAGAHAWLDRDAMQLGETVTLNVEVEGDAGGEPDFTPLGGDFGLLGTQSSKQFSLVNGRSTTKNLWAIGLEPKRTGTFTIPSIKVGALETQPLRLVVAAAPAGALGRPGDEVFVEASAEPAAPWVQQQVRLVVKLYYAVDLTEGALGEPVADGIVVQKLGRDRPYGATVGGRRYNVLERHYALIPERSGTQVIPPIAFRGSVLDRSDPTGFFRRGRAVSAQSEAISLDVQPKPADWGTAPWLPAASLALSDESTLPDRIAVGEPVTRTLRIRAQGLGYEQLPELMFEAPAGAELYPDKTETQTRDDGTWLFGERTRKFAVVPSRPGTLVLPELRVDWWDTAQQRRVSAILPAHAIEVTGAAATVATAAAPAATSTIQWPDADAGAEARRWRVAALAFAALWLVTLVAWWHWRRPRVAPAGGMRPPSEPPGRASFMRACAIGDLVTAGQGLLAWARSERAEVRNLGEVAQRLADVDQCAVLADLERARYAGADSQGLATRLATGFRGGFRWKPDAVVAKSAPALPPLYPEP